MKITNEILERFGLQFENNIKEMNFIETIIKYYGNFPLNLFHYIRKYYRLSEEEFAIYCSFCQISNCNNFWDCFVVENSENIYNGYYVTNSKFIRDSEFVSDSVEIYNSKATRKSKNVAHSNDIKNSEIVIESQQVHDSNNIARSNDIYWSKVILNSSFLKDCSYTYMSDNSTDCHFCGFVRNSRHCLFCVGLENKEYYIFNQPVSQMEYETIKETLMALLEAEKSTMIKINESKHTAEERFKLSRRFDSIINGLSPEFFGWVGTLPNYSDDVFVSLFFRDREETL